MEIVQQRRTTAETKGRVGLSPWVRATILAGVALATVMALSFTGQPIPGRAPALVADRSYDQVEAVRAAGRIPALAVDRSYDQVEAVRAAGRMPALAVDRSYDAVEHLRAVRPGS